MEQGARDRFDFEPLAFDLDDDHDVVELLVGDEVILQDSILGTQLPRRLRLRRVSSEVEALVVEAVPLGLGDVALRDETDRDGEARRAQWARSRAVSFATM